MAVDPPMRLALHDALVAYGNRALRADDLLFQLQQCRLNSTDPAFGAFADELLAGFSDEEMPEPLPSDSSHLVFLRGDGTIWTPKTYSPAFGLLLPFAIPALLAYPTGVEFGVPTALVILVVGPFLGFAVLAWLTT